MSAAILSWSIARSDSQVLTRLRPIRPSGNMHPAIRDACLPACGSTSKANIVYMPGDITRSISAHSSQLAGVNGLVIVPTHLHSVSVIAALNVLVLMISSMACSDMSMPKLGLAAAQAVRSHMSQLSGALNS